ncbi:MAG: hypothetical protein GYA51_18875 [Candidatus Methanofastidiosa archaeon]|nr:hypothetical protein [Candidatus Methanofastidiosa archaeon]
MTTKFTNADRHRYYGLRIGDLVQIKVGVFSKPKNAEVIDYGFLDNNRVILRLEDGTETDWVAEWCTIVEKVEDRVQ